MTGRHSDPLKTPGARRTGEVNYLSIPARPAAQREDSAVCMPRPAFTAQPEPPSPPSVRDHQVPSELSLSSLSVQGQSRHEVSDLLARAIHDFEDLLDQALSLARQAAELEDNGYASRRDSPDDTARGRLPGPNHAPPTLEPPAVKHREGQLLDQAGRTVARQPTYLSSQGNSSLSANANQSRVAARPFATDWANSTKNHASKTPRTDAADLNRLGKFDILDVPYSAVTPLKESHELLQRRDSKISERLSRSEIREYIKSQNQVPIEPRTSSQNGVPLFKGHKQRQSDRRAWREAGGNVFELRPSPEFTSLLDEADEPFAELALDPFRNSSVRSRRVSRIANIETEHEGLELRNTRHVDIYGETGSHFSRSCRHQPIARDWHIVRKRYTAAVTCINTALLGIVVGIYAGEVPALQYVLVDLHHWVILGNTFLYTGLAIPTLLLWPLPLLHGRKPYTVAALALALPLQIPQGVAVGAFRSPSNPSYRVLLLFCRGLSGFVLGFAAINFKMTLLDLFGASLMSSNPHQEVVYDDDLRRHGGGLGLWLGWWSWCTIGSISLGFFIGASIVESVNVTWGFWVSTFCIICVMLLNIVTPEVRRSSYRRTIAEIIKRDGDKMKRVARGEVKMHLRSRGPLWWGEEVKAGMELSWKMLKQPGFFILAIYLAWVHAQFTLVLMLLGALISKYYHHRPIYVGLCVFAMALGALLATPFQKASYFSRARHHPQRTDSMTFEKRVTMSSHMTRRLVFMIVLPLSAIAYALTATGPPLSPLWPSLMAALVAFLSNLAIAECNGLIMETFDTSDLQHGMTGRKRVRMPAEDLYHGTTFSCYPRVSAGFALTQGLGYVFIAAATATCGGMERRLGAREATGVVAAMLMCLTIALTAVLFRFKVVQMIPDRRGPTRKDTEWEPVIIGNPSGTTRRVSLLELGNLSRWMEIRRRNRLHDTPT